MIHIQPRFDFCCCDLFHLFSSKTRTNRHTTNTNLWLLINIKIYHIFNKKYSSIIQYKRI